MLRLFETQLARSLLALAVLVGIAIAGYMVLEGWSLLDAAYMTVITFTTVGYEEVHPLSTTGRVLHHVPHGCRRRVLPHDSSTS